MLYWKEQGKFQKEAERIMDDNIPSYGYCEKTIDECLRCLISYNHDLHNNGHGGFQEKDKLNWAVDYLATYRVIDENEGKVSTDDDKNSEMIDHLIDK